MTKTYTIKKQIPILSLEHIEITAEEIQKLIAENPEILEVKKGGKPKNGSPYRILTSLNTFSFCTWCDTEEDNYQRDTGNFYITKEKCEARQAINNAKANVMAYIRDNELGREFEIAFEDDNYYINIDRLEGKFRINSTCYTDDLPLLGHFISREACQQVINNNRADLNLIYGIK